MIADAGSHVLNGATPRRAAGEEGTYWGHASIEAEPQDTNWRAVRLAARQKARAKTVALLLLRRLVRALKTWRGALAAALAAAHVGGAPAAWVANQVATLAVAAFPDAERNVVKL